MKKSILIAFVASVSLLASACGGAPSLPPTSTPLLSSGDDNPPPPDSAPAIQFSLWHGLTGGVEDQAIPKFASDFNALQPKCQVEVTDQDYERLLNELQASLQSSSPPVVVYLKDVDTRWLIDLDAAAPIKNFLIEERAGIQDLEPGLLAHYTLNDQLYAMPFSTHSVLVYYNQAIFEAAGLDPEQLRTLDEFADYARQLTQREGSSQVTRYGAALAIDGLFFEQFLAASGGYYVDQNNGRDGVATQATFNAPAGVKILEWWKGMYDEGSLLSLDEQDDVRQAFLAGQAAMLIDSTAMLHELVDAAQGQFEVGAAFLPRPSLEAIQGWGPTLASSGWWIMKDASAIEQACGWEFIKFLIQPEQQADWHAQSGYYATRISTYRQPLAQEWLARYPQFQTALDQLYQMPNNRAAQGAVLGVFPTARQAVETAIRQTLAGEAPSDEALDEAAAAVTRAIRDYNAVMGIE
jgi:sn-glycerol 3-phosphate transport system substrate-binding protein